MLLKLACVLIAVGFTDVSQGLCDPRIDKLCQLPPANKCRDQTEKDCTTVKPSRYPCLSMECPADSGCCTDFCGMGQCQKFYPSCRNFTKPDDCTGPLTDSVNCDDTPCPEGAECCLGPCGDQRCQKVYPRCPPRNPSKTSPCGRPIRPLDCDYVQCEEGQSCCNDECWTGHCI